MFRHSYLLTQKLVRKAMEKRQNSIRVDHTIVFILLWEQTWHQPWRDFFHIQLLVQNWKHCTLRYPCGLNYFAHFDSTITQNHVVDYVNHFGGSHFHWESRTMLIFCGCMATFKLIYPIVNRCKHRSRCTMNFIRFSKYTIVYYFPRRIMRVITLWATMLAGDRSRDKAETKPRRD